MPDYSKHSVQDHLELTAAKLHEIAYALPHGDKRELLLHKAVKMKAASLIIDRWMSSPGLRPPR
jgi:hypothetical protein